MGRTNVHKTTRLRKVSDNGKAKRVRSARDVDNDEMDALFEIPSYYENIDEIREKERKRRRALSFEGEGDDDGDIELFDASGDVKFAAQSNGADDADTNDGRTQQEEKDVDSSGDNEDAEPTQAQQDASVCGAKMEDRDDANFEDDAEYVPRQRRSATSGARNRVQKAQVIRNVMPSFGDAFYPDWDSFFEAWNAYKERNFLKFRTRTSLTTDTYNAKYKLEGRSAVPSRFTHAYKSCMHNHATTEELYRSYMRSSEVTDDRLLKTLDAFTATNTETKQVAEFIATTYGAPMSSQQIRNLINSRLGSSNADERVKDMLQGFVERDGNSCLVIQNSWELTCAIVIQSAAQKEIFRRWGDNLLLDWTHNTNNVGYYLGSLVVTVATGRGVPVFDFLCLDQRKGTIEVVMGHFKKLNPTWERIESVVIDKDFAEWSALAKVFPAAKVLLCQFHALKYIRTILASRKYSIKVADRGELEELFRGMVYASSEDFYALKKGHFCSRAEAVSKSFREYFDKNWDSCSDMWSNYGRGRYFTAGNTTTNRIEANWNQFKQLLGKKTSIDKCLKTIFKHQACVLREFVSAISFHCTKTFLFVSYPVSLNQLAATLSPFCMRKVRRQWDYNVVNRAKWTWSQEAVPATHIVYTTRTTTGHQIVVSIADRGPWTCNCLFNMSTRLPCQHLLNVVSEELGLAEFPIVRMNQRWSMTKASKVAQLLVDTANHLGLICGPSVVARKPGTRTSTQRIGYVKLRFGEQSEQLVLSECEKYNVVQAELMPLVDLLKNLPSHQFYVRFAELKDSLNSLKAKWHKREEHGGKIEDIAEVTEQSDSEIEEVDPASALDFESGDAVLQEDDDRRKGDAPREYTGPQGLDVTFDQVSLGGLFFEHPSQVTQPDLSISDLSQKIIDEGRAAAQVSHENANTDEVAQLHRGLEVLTIPKPKVTTPRRRTTTQNRKFARHEFVECRSECPIGLDVFIVWAKSTPNLNLVKDAMNQYPVLFNAQNLADKECFVREMPVSCVYMHNFVIPPLLTKRVSSALMEWNKNHADKLDLRDGCVVNQVDENLKTTPVVYLSSGLVGLSEEYVVRLVEFYQLQSRVSAYIEDMEWLVRDWRAYDTVTSSFMLEDIDVGGKVLKSSEIAGEVAQLFEASWLGRCFSLANETDGESFAVRFADIVGRVARTSLLSDVTLMGGLRFMCSKYAHCHVVDSCVVTNEVFHLPDKPLMLYKHVIVPINMAAKKHWGVHIVNVMLPRKIVAHLYDPMGSSANTKLMEGKWTTYTLPLLKKWFERDTTANVNITADVNVFPTDVSFKWVHSPLQNDGSSCGVFCAARVHTSVTNSASFEHTPSPSFDEIQVMRLRLLYKLTVAVQGDAEPIETGAQHEVSLKIRDYFKLKLR
ncbi:hypothetical protein FI667_g1540, partial [Globisporangium splendens]